MGKIERINIKDVELKLNVNLARYTTIKLGGLGNIAICKSISGLQELIKKLNELKIDYHLVGWGANQVLLNTKKYLYIKLDLSFDKNILKKVHDSYTLPASCPLNLLTSHATKFGIKGWEVFTGIPASIGGAVYMNAGTALGEISELITSVKIMRIDGSIYDYVPREDSFSYRNNNFVKDGEVIIEVTITHKGLDSSIPQKISEYLEYRKATQPLTTKNCGSVFKNRSELKAGTTIDKSGLKEFGLEHVKVSSKHGNFIENDGEGMAKEFFEVVTELTQEIERYSGYKFELEAKVY